ncbi:MAG TPA: hypothetical protein VIQ30_25250 [Pseudonocardia sp.]
MTSGYNYLPPLVKPPAPAFIRTTPEPVYADAGPVRLEDKPAQIERHDHVRALAAVHQARKRYPGVVGEILASEIESYKTLGCVAQPSAPVVRLIRELTASEQA